MFISNENSLIGGRYIDAKFDFSPATRNRRIKDGTIPKPDVPATTNGACNKWLKSTIDEVFNAQFENKEGA